MLQERNKNFCKNSGVYLKIENFHSMENFLRHLIQFLSCFEIKAQQKNQKKKRWLITREVLITLDYADDKVRDVYNEDYLTPKYNSKLKCAYDAATHGAKEGVISGVFLGGCWGLLRENNRKFTTVRDKEIGKEPANQSYLHKPNSRSSKKNSSIKEPFLYKTEVLERNSLLENHQEKNVAIHRKRVQKVLSSLPENESYTLPIKNQMNKNKVHMNRTLSGPRGTRFYDNDFKKSNERVEIVGYAFIHTSDSLSSNNSDSDSNKSDNSVKSKGTGSENNKKNKNEAYRHLQRNKVSQVKSFSKIKNLQKKLQKEKSEEGTNISINSTNQSKKISENSVRNRQIIIEQRKSIILRNIKIEHSEIFSPETELSRNTLPMRAEETFSDTECSGSYRNFILSSIPHIEPQIQDSQHCAQQRKEVKTDSSSYKNRSSKISSTRIIKKKNSEEYSKPSRLLESKSKEKSLQRSSILKEKKNEKRKLKEKTDSEAPIYTASKSKKLPFFTDTHSISNGFISDPKADSSTQLHNQNTSNFSQVRINLTDCSKFSIESINETDVRINESQNQGQSSTFSFSQGSNINSRRDEGTSKSFSPRVVSPQINEMHSESIHSVASHIPLRCYVNGRSDKNSQKLFSPKISESSVKEAKDRSLRSKNNSVSTNSYVFSRIDQDSDKSLRMSNVSSYIPTTSYVSIETDSCKSISPEKVGSSVGEFLNQSLLNTALTRSYDSNKENLCILEASNQELISSQVNKAQKQCRNSKNNSAFIGSYVDEEKDRYTSSSPEHKIPQSSETKYKKRYSSNPESTKPYYLEKLNQRLYKIDGSEYSKTSADRRAVKRNYKPSLTESQINQTRKFLKEHEKSTCNCAKNINPKRASSVKSTDVQTTGFTEERVPRDYSYFSSLNEDIIIMSACNCAIVLGVICSIISVTRVSLAR